MEAYIKQSLCVLIFLSRGYFNSNACLREARAAIAEDKHLIIVHESDPDYGGATLEQLEREAPDDLKQALFHNTNDEIICWLRLPAFQDEVIVAIAERLMKLCHGDRHTGSTVTDASPDYPLGGAATKWLRRMSMQSTAPASLQLFMPGSLAATDFLVGPTKVFVSEHNVGAKEVAEKLIGYFKAGSQAQVVEKALRSENGVRPKTLHVTRSATSKRRLNLRLTSSQECMLLYLEADLFQREAGHLTDSLCTQLHEALDTKQQIILLHPIRAVAFDHIIDTCPRELISRGLLRCIAVQLQPEPLELVSAGMLAKMLGGKPTPKRWQDVMSGRESSSGAGQMLIARRTVHLAARIKGLVRGRQVEKLTELTLQDQAKLS